MSATRKDLRQAAELLRKGATLLKEPCPQCNGILLLYQGSQYCLNCGILPKPGPKEVITSKAAGTHAEQTSSFSTLENVSYRRLQELSEKLQSPLNLEEELKYVELAKAYLQLLKLLQSSREPRRGA